MKPDLELKFLPGGERDSGAQTGNGVADAHDADRIYVQNDIAGIGKRHVLKGRGIQGMAAEINCRRRGLQRRSGFFARAKKRNADGTFQVRARNGERAIFCTGGRRSEEHGHREFIAGSEDDWSFCGLQREIGAGNMQRAEIHFFGTGVGDLQCLRIFLADHNRFEIDFGGDYRNDRASGASGGISRRNGCTTGNHERG